MKRQRNIVAKDLRTPKYAKRIVASRMVYNRKKLKFKHHKESVIND